MLKLQNSNKFQLSMERNQRQQQNHEKIIQKQYKSQQFNLSKYYSDLEKYESTLKHNKSATRLKGQIKPAFKREYISIKQHKFIKKQLRSQKSGDSSLTVPQKKKNQKIILEINGQRILDGLITKKDSGNAKKQLENVIQELHKRNKVNLLAEKYLQKFNFPKRMTNKQKLQQIFRKDQLMRKKLILLQKENGQRIKS